MRALHFKFMIDSGRLSPATDWWLMLFKFIAASYGVMFTRFAWLIFVEAVTFDQFIVCAIPTICSSISCGATWVTIPLCIEIVRLLIPTVKNHLLRLNITFLLSFLYPMIWVVQVWVMSLFSIETWNFRFTLSSFVRYVALETANRFANLFAKNLVMSVRLSAPWALWIQRQLSLHIPTAAGILGKWLFFGFVDGCPSVAFFDACVGSANGYLGKMIQYSISDDYLCILQKGMRQAFGFPT
jgi:hypothetical protein